MLVHCKVAPGPLHRFRYMYRRIISSISSSNGVSNKRLMDDVFVITRKIKIKKRVISRRRRLKQSWRHTLPVSFSSLPISSSRILITAFFILFMKWSGISLSFMAFWLQMVTAGNFTSCWCKQTKIYSVDNKYIPWSQRFFFIFLFYWLVSSWESCGKLWNVEHESRSGEKGKPLVTKDLNLTLIQMPGSGSDCRGAPIGWYFHKHTNQNDWSVYLSLHLLW